MLRVWLMGWMDGCDGDFDIDIDRRGFSGRRRGDRTVYQVGIY